jgi:hypothetical protein
MSETIETVLADEGLKRDNQGRRILEDARWEELIEQYQTSGLTQAQFARREGIKYYTFVGRLGRHRRAGGKKVVKAKFLEARLPSAPAIRLEVTLPCGMLVRGDSPEALARLIRALQA